MRWLLNLPLALLPLAAPVFAAPVLAAPVLLAPARPDLLAEKAPAELSGSKTIRLSETRGAETLVVGKRASAGLRVAVPARPDSDGKKKLPADGWFLVVEADLLKAKADAEVWVRWKDASTEWTAIDWSAIDEDPAEGATPPAAAESGAPPIPGRAPASALAGRVLAFIPLPDGAARELDLEFENRGRKITVRAARVMRFHGAPSRAMRGKANGPFGPDQIGCGMLGFTALTEHQHTAFNLIDVRADGPAAAAGLERGDLVLAVSGKPLGRSSLAPGWDWFERSHEAALGRAIEGALEDGQPAVKLTYLRPSDGAAPPLRTATIALPFEGPIGPRFPLSGPGADRFRGDLLSWTLGHQKRNGSWPGTDAVNPALGALALLGTGDEQHLEAVKRSLDRLMKLNPSPSQMTGLAYWTIAFQGMLLCEYHLRTGDESVLPWVEEAVRWLPTTTHECKWGMQAFGHGPDGLPYDNKALMAPAAHLLVFDALARRAGVESRIWEHIEPYVRHSWSNPDDGGHGAMGYNASYRDKGEFWSRTGLCALAEVLREDRADLAPLLCVLMEERHPWMLNSHAYGEPGAVLGLLSLAVVKPKTFEEILPQWRWRFLCSWEPGYGLRYSTPHMGAPYLGEEAIVNLAYLLLLSTENDGLLMSTTPR